MAAPNMGAALTNAKNIARLVMFGGATVYAATHSIFNVEGGHRAIVFNRLVGIKDTVSRARRPPRRLRHGWRASLMVGSLERRSTARARTWSFPCLSGPSSTTSARALA